MAKQSAATLKTYFNTGDKPTETQFANLIDSFINKTDDVGDYKEYAFHLKYDGDSGITVTPIINKIGNITVTLHAAGEIWIESSSLFTIKKTTVIKDCGCCIDDGDTAYSTRFVYWNSSKIAIEFLNVDPSKFNPYIQDSIFIVRVYS